MLVGSKHHNLIPSRCTAKCVYTNPDVRITDKERSAMPLKTTAGFMHHKLKVYVQTAATFPACVKETFMIIYTNITKYLASLAK